MEKIYRQTKREIEYLLLHQELLSASEKQDLTKSLRAVELDLALLDREAEKKRLLSDYFYFLKQAWPWVDNSTLIENWHISMMCRYLQALQKRMLFRNLIINVPPGCSKSLNTMVIWPAWVFAKNPAERILCASYDGDLVKKQAVDSKRLMSSDWYQSFFGNEVQVRDDVNTQNYFETTAGGSRFSTTPRGKATGRHPTVIACFPAGTMVDTNCGPVPIECVVKHPEKYMVRGGSGMFRRVLRVYISDTQKLIEIKHEAGEFRCTQDHPIWVDGKGWVEANAIVCDQKLRRLRKVGSYGKQREVLQFRVLQRNEAASGHDCVRIVRKVVLQTPGTRKARPDVLQQEVFKPRNDGNESPTFEARTPASLRYLRARVLSAKRNQVLASGRVQQRVSRQDAANMGRIRIARLSAMRIAVSSKKICPEGVLLSRLFERSAFKANAGREQQQLHSRKLQRNVPQAVSFDASRSVSKGRRTLPIVRIAHGFVRSRARHSPHRPRPVQQRNWQPDNSLPMLPWAYARQCAVTKVVAKNTVGFVGKTYNLEVETDNTYFANGVLVHNCDDLSNPRQAESKVEREALIDWWDGTMETRGAAAEMNRARVLIGQRLSQTDIPGHVMSNDIDKEWARLILPMRYEPNRMPDIGLGNDPRKEIGELLDPVRFPDRTVKGIERRLGIFGTAGQLQQRPTAKKGAIFKIDEIKYVDLEAVPMSKIARFKRAWDKAGTEDAGDYTAGALGGIVLGERTKVFVFDVVHDQWSTDEVESQMALWAKLDEKRFGFSKFETVFEEEPGASGIQAAKETKRRLRRHRIRSKRPTGSKLVRAEPLANAIAAGEVYFVNGPWVRRAVEEMRYFPKGEHDDQVDAISLLYMELVNGSAFEESAEDMEAELQKCSNKQCDRMATEESEYCCDSCRVADERGTALHESAHCPECAYRHSQLYASGEWEPKEA
jgi:predicted phage terminase large subunit-like protein